MAEVDLAAGEPRTKEVNCAAGELGLAEVDLAAGELAAAEVDLAAGEPGPAEGDRAGELDAAEGDRAGELDAAEVDRAGELGVDEGDLAGELGAAEFRLAGELGPAEVDLAGELGAAEVDRGGELGVAEVDLAGELGVAEDDRAGELGVAEDDRAGELGAAEVAAVEDNARESKYRPRQDVGSSVAFLRWAVMTRMTVWRTSRTAWKARLLASKSGSFSWPGLGLGSGSYGMRRYAHRTSTQVCRFSTQSSASPAMAYTPANRTAGPLITTQLVGCRGEAFVKGPGALLRECLPELIALGHQCPVEPLALLCECDSSVLGGRLNLLLRIRPSGAETDNLGNHSANQGEDAGAGCDHSRGDLRAHERNLLQIAAPRCRGGYTPSPPMLPMLPCCCLCCENFLYRFKAARGPPRRRHGGPAGLPLTLPPGRPNAGRLARTRSPGRHG